MTSPNPHHIKETLDHLIDAQHSLDQAYEVASASMSAAIEDKIKAMGQALADLKCELLGMVKP
jgi:hypothetical protein